MDHTLYNIVYFYTGRMPNIISYTYCVGEMKLFPDIVKKIAFLKHSAYSVVILTYS